MKQEPFRITLEHFDTKITVERPYSEITSEELKELLRSVCLAAGYSEKLVIEMFGE